MTSTDPLFALIHSLNKAEKIFFKKYSSLHQSSGKASNYVLLFEAIDKMKTYDEEKLKKKFSNSSVEKYLAASKNYLYNLLVKSMGIFHSYDHVHGKIREQMNSYFFLEDKGLNAQSHKLLQKIKTAANKYDYYPLIIDALRHERMHNLRQSTDKMEILIDQNQRDLRQTIEMIGNDLLMTRIYDIAYLEMTRQGPLREDEKLYKIEAIKNELDKHSLNPETQSFFFRSKYYSFLDTYAVLKGDWQESFVQNEKLLAVYENNPHQIEEHPRGYLFAINNFLNTAIRIYEYEPVHLALEKMWQLKEAHPQISISILERYYHFKMLAPLHCGNFTEAKEVADDLLKNILPSYKDRMVKAKLLTLYYDLTQLYFGLEDLDNALFYNNLILNEFRDLLFDDFITESRIVHLMIHFELENNDYLTARINSLYRSISHELALRKTERSFISFLKGFVKLTDKKERIKRIEQLKDELVELQSNPFESFVVKETRLLNWVQSKLTEKTLQETLEEACQAFLTQKN